ncbi:MAG: NADH-quinone oxidoreductase subunit L [Chloroflexi bacterium]|nr:NADH-quinone oxidoreductase subunit L [Chloroflexota bacterium]
MGLFALALVILLAPLTAFVLNALLARRAWRLAGALTIAGVGVAFLASLAVFAQVHGQGARLDVSFPWLTIAPLVSRSIEIGLRIDPLTAVMLLSVSGVSLLVQIYSWGYLHEVEYDEHGHPHVHRDPGFSRYYTWMALFTFSMLGLVLANGLLLLFICWELVGLCSYLLIGYWYTRPAAALAAKKAFLTTRVGDFGFMLGLFYLWWQTGTFTFSTLEALVANNTIPPLVATIGALLLFCGAVGKSAQWPLHVWLPDAMEGPTPVSALIHAATMVAAGVYLVARSFFLFQHGPEAMVVVALIGGFTAIFAATMGLVNNDIKRVMAYSTCSQLGYMMLALGAGGLAAGTFHLFTHSWFKALLFLTAGAVIHSTGTQDMREMGGLRAKMPGTFWAMTLAGLALAGIPPLAGFWSKDGILGAVYDSPTVVAVKPLLLAFALITVFLTAFYMGRVLFLTFGGQWRGDAHVWPHVHEAPAVMLWPMLVLIVPTVLVGFWNYPFGPGDFAYGHFVERSLLHAHGLAETFHPELAFFSIALAVAGLVVAWAMYGARVVSAAAVTRAFGPLYGWALNRWGFDHLYNWLVGTVWVGFARGIAAFDLAVIDGIVNGVARATVALGQAFRPLQTGQVQTYAWVVFGGLIVVAIAIMLGSRI